jgi:hypothetical protein
MLFFLPSKRGFNFAKIRGFKVTDYSHARLKVEIVKQTTTGKQNRLEKSSNRATVSHARFSALARFEIYKSILLQNK